MNKPWQEMVSIHHIDGNARNNDPGNLRIVHARTGELLTDREQDEYVRWTQNLIADALDRGMKR